MSDFISRQAAIARAVPLNLFGREVMMVSVSELENLPSAQQWILCSERLPEESGDYLVTVEHYSGELWIEVDQFDNENESWWHYMDDVTAWMPLPEPYKGEEECESKK